MATKIYSAALGIAETETVAVLATALKKRIYPDAVAKTSTETVLGVIGRNWFPALNDVETDSSASAATLIRRASEAMAQEATETSIAHFALWPEPPSPTGDVFYQGATLHKQSLKQGKSHQLGFTVTFTETTPEQVAQVNLIFEAKRSDTDKVVFRRVRFGSPGGIIIDSQVEVGDGKYTISGAIQLRNYETIFPESDLELSFVLTAENTLISRSSDVISGTVIFNK